MSIISIKNRSLDIPHIVNIVNSKVQYIVNSKVYKSDMIVASRGKNRKIALMIQAHNQRKLRMKVDTI